MPSGSYVYDGSRIGDSNRNWQAAEDVDVENWKIGDHLVLAIMYGSDDHAGDADDLKLQWENTTGNPGVWTDLGAAGELKFSGVGDTVLADLNAVIHTEEGCTPIEANHDDGVEHVGTNTATWTVTDKFRHCEHQYAIDTSGASASAQYTFRVWNVTDGALEDVALAQVTMGALAVPRTFGIIVD